MKKTITSRLEVLLAKIAGKDASLETMTPGVPINLSEKLMLDIADRLDGIAENTPPEVTATDNGDVLTVVDGAWAKAAPSGNSGILVANIIDQQEEPYNTIINKTFAELAAADVVILRYIAAGDPLDPSSEFTVCCTIANAIGNANSALMVVYDNELMLGQVGVNTFVASSVNDYPVAFGSEP